MKVNRAILEDQLERYETQLKSLTSFSKELNARVEEHGTDRAQIEDDLIETENNVKYYEGEIARIKKELGGSVKASSAPKAADSVLPRTAKQGLGSLILSAIGFAAGTVFGSRMKARQAGKDAAGEKAGKDSGK
jgi:septal ring factor EnvC (AmiA/AmiB activator)